MGWCHLVVALCSWARWWRCVGTDRKRPSLYPYPNGEGHGVVEAVNAHLAAPRAAVAPAGAGRLINSIQLINLVCVCVYVCEFRFEMVLAA